LAVGSNAPETAPAQGFGWDRSVRGSAFAKLYARTATFAELTGRNISVGVDLYNNGSRHQSPGGGSFSCRVIFRLAFVPDAAPWHSGTPAWHTCRGFTMLEGIVSFSKA